MKKYSFFISLLFISLLNACYGQKQSPLEGDEVSSEHEQQMKLPLDSQIASYVRNMIQDKNGDFWFGTNGYGVAHYNGKSVTYYSNDQGFKGRQVTGVCEDLDKNLWFATDQGVVKYEWESDGSGKKEFVNFVNFNSLENMQFWSVFADGKGGIWAGSISEIYYYNGSTWSQFELPLPEKESGSFITNATTWSITEDSKGNMWFSTNGFGVFKYDGENFTKFSKKDGLCDDRVDVVMEDSDGIMWFGTRYGGISSFDGKTFVNFTLDKMVKGYEVCEIREDKVGNIWFSSEGYGVYRYDGQTFTNYSKDAGLEVLAPQSIFEDMEGRLWVGGGGGLYRFENSRFINVKRDGPWQ